ncbi:DGQHR domain-containing protein [Paenibacillus piscarius]|uniref:DGQHR domain-containing protein n=1 Tax=Paenibacillus piscarius TaxID=1089681 RepID=UPI001EE82160|nr:DGQHR domain-containing protein [Paenibacillus piscarius]
MAQLPQHHVIENVLQSKMRGKVTYQGNLLASTTLQLTYVKPYDHPSGKGYQRPVDNKRCNDFAMYLSKGENALFTPILLNAESHWVFAPYDKNRPTFGRLLCKNKASLMDGQHRLGGIKRYTQDTNSELQVPFLAFHYLDEDEEIQLFDAINTKAKGIGSSLSRYLKRGVDDNSWIATELIINGDSPFHFIGTLTGKRNAGKHVTLQNLYKILDILFKSPEVSQLTKEKKLMLAVVFFNCIKENYNKEWLDYKNYRLTHIVCLNAFAFAGAKLFLNIVRQSSKHTPYEEITKNIKKIRGIDWSSDGPLKYIKGISGSKSLAADMISMF